MKRYDLAVMGGGFAGVAAALAAARSGASVRALDVRELQRVLKQNGAYIGL